MPKPKTPITDSFKTKIKTICGNKYWVPVDVAKELETKLYQYKEMFDMQTKIVVDLELRLSQMEKTHAN